MKITIRLIVSLILVIAVVAIVFSFYQVRSEKERLTDELERRVIILAETLQESIKPMLQSGSLERLNRLLERFGNRERLKGVVIFDRQGNIFASSSDLIPKIKQPFPQAITAISENRGLNDFININGNKTYIYVLPISDEKKFSGTLVLFHDASYIDVRLREIWKYNILRFLTLSIFITIITLLVVRWSITGPIAQIAEWMRELRTGKEKITKPKISTRGNILAPLISEVTHLAKSLAVARAKVEEETKERIKAETLWTAQRLKECVRAELGDKKLFLISNREPYMHVKEGSNFKCIVPAGGLVTALDPVMRICDGIWIAHGSGNGDREFVDNNDQVRVPPENPSYTLKRIWLTKEEEDGYYYGFSNEGIWPLCHITHTRPVFRLEDWVNYQKVNEKFAEALLKEISDEEAPLVLIQDYHLALLPFLVKKKRPDVRVALFWHIPWPNPEAFGICPWRQEILIGMLGADLMGFQIQFFATIF